MMIHEFTARTGYKPSYEDYQAIEEQYSEYDGNKDEFCAQWLKEYNRANHKLTMRFSRIMAEIYEIEGKTPAFFALRDMIAH